MTEPRSERARRVPAVLDLIAAEDTDRLVPDLLGFAEMADGHWGHEGRKVLDAVCAADARFQGALVLALADRYHELEVGARARRNIVVLLANLQNLHPTVDAHGFGDLGASAETRRALLERLIPRLAIADRCTIEGRFPRVKGERHTYKIHFGSGNILMTPNDQYLCIVPKSSPSAPQAGYLPYEGDRMLADDMKITDPTILSQL
ncbi:DUF7737 domain-containing protein [Streptomyces sp. NPDC055013]